MKWPDTAASVIGFLSVLFWVRRNPRLSSSPGATQFFSEIPAIHHLQTLLRFPVWNYLSLKGICEDGPKWRIQNARPESSQAQLRSPQSWSRALQRNSSYCPLPNHLESAITADRSLFGCSNHILRCTNQIIVSIVDFYLLTTIFLDRTRRESFWSSNHQEP